MRRTPWASTFCPVGLRGLDLRQCDLDLFVGALVRVNAVFEEEEALQYRAHRFLLCLGHSTGNAAALHEVAWKRLLLGVVVVQQSVVGAHLRQRERRRALLDGADPAGPVVHCLRLFARVSDGRVSVTQRSDRCLAVFPQTPPYWGCPALMGWGPGKGSNLRPTHYECAALPTELPGRSCNTSHVVGAEFPIPVIGHDARNGCVHRAVQL